MRFFQGLMTFVTFAVCQKAGDPAEALPKFPRQFSATVEITSHIVDRAKDYPPWRREIILWYDHVARRAKVVMTDDLHAGKTFLRMYDLKKDYMLRGGEYASCRRSYLDKVTFLFEGILAKWYLIKTHSGEAMPTPDYPRTAVFQGTVALDGLSCDHWVHRDEMSLVHLYIDSTTQAPRRLTEEALTSDTTAIPIISYDFLDFKTGPQAPELFNLPEPYTSDEDCDLHVGGYPYMHLFRHYLRV